jgi:hypothetical protein
MAKTANEQVREVTADEIEAVSGGVIAIIRPENRPADDRLVALLPYIEQK